MKYKLISIACLSLLSTYSIFAAPASSGLKGSPYVGAQVGYGGAQTPDISITGMTTTRYDGVGLGIEGGYLFKLHSGFKLGPELGYKSYPNNTYKSAIPFHGDTLSVTFSGHYFDLLANAQYTFNTNWVLMAKLGAAAVTQEEADDLGSIKGKKDNNAILPELVFGVGYNFTPQFSVNISYDNVFGSTLEESSVGSVSNTKVASITTYMLGVTYSFA